jgi:hypothetical protein
MTDDAMEAEIAKAIEAVRAALAPLLAIRRAIPGGERAARALLEQIAARTEEQVRRAIFAQRMDRAKRARAEACLAAMRATLEAL